MSHVCHRYSSSGDHAGRFAFSGGGAKGFGTVTSVSVRGSIDCLARSTLSTPHYERDAVHLMTDFVRTDSGTRDRR